LACVLFESLAGRPPYAREDEGAVIFAHITEPPPSLTAVRSDLPPEIDEVILTGMAKEKDDRYPYCVAFARAARAALLGQRAVTPPTGITSGEREVADAIEDRIEDAPGSPPIGVPAPPAPTPLPPTTMAPGPQTPAPAPETAPAPYVPPVEPGPTPVPAEPAPGDRKRLAIVLAAVVAAVVGIGAFVLLSGGEGDQVAARPTGAATGTAPGTGTTGTTGGTGTSGTTGAVETPLSLAEAQVFGTWNMTFSPAGDASAGSATNAAWELKANCENRTGPHPCDVDALSPMSGFLLRKGKSYTGDVTGDFLCGPGDMQVSFEVTKAAPVEGPWRATEIRGEGTMASGTCPGSVFTFVGTLA